MPETSEYQHNPEREQDNMLAEQIRSLESENSNELQEILNNRFTEENRNRLLDNAATDTNGRKVRLYRKVDVSFFADTLEKGEQTPYDYFDKDAADRDHYASFDDPVDQRGLYYVADSLGAYNDIEKRRNDGQKLREILVDGQGNLSDFFAEQIPEASKQEIDDAFSNPTYGSVLSFVEKYYPMDVQQRMHSGGRQMFSPLLSTSVGGVVIPDIDGLRESGRNVVYVEYVPTEDEIIPHQKKTGLAEVEKEVFIKKMNVDQISRVFVTNKQIEDEILDDETSALGDFYARNKESYDNASADRIVKDWSNSESIDDCLPN